MQNRVIHPDAVAYIRGSEEFPQLHGNAKFYQKNNSVLIVVNVSGLPLSSVSDFFALHIHEGGRCTGDDFSDTLGHYNPLSLPHPRHAGDLAPLLSCRGTAYLAMLSDRFSVKDIIGKTIVIHSDPDDFHSQPAGNAGVKIACGIIRRAGHK